MKTKENIAGLDLCFFQEYPSWENDCGIQEQAENVCRNVRIPVHNSEYLIVSVLTLSCRYGSDDEEPEKDEKLLENHEKPESLTTFVQSTRSESLTATYC